MCTHSTCKLFSSDFLAKDIAVCRCRGTHWRRKHTRAGIRGTQWLKRSFIETEYRLILDWHNALQKDNNPFNDLCNKYILLISWFLAFWDAVKSCHCILVIIISFWWTLHTFVFVSMFLYNCVAIFKTRETTRTAKKQIRQFFGRFVKQFAS